MAGRVTPDLTDWSAQAAHYTNPDLPFPPGRPCGPGEGAAALIEEAFGTRDAAGECVRRGRPRIGGSQGHGESR